MVVDSLVGKKDVRQKESVLASAFKHFLELSTVDKVKIVVPVVLISVLITASLVCLAVHAAQPSLFGLHKNNNVMLNVEEGVSSLFKGNKMRDLVASVSEDKKNLETTLNGIKDQIQLKLADLKQDIVDPSVRLSDPQVLVPLSVVLLVGLVVIVATEIVLLHRLGRL